MFSIKPNETTLVTPMCNTSLVTCIRNTTALLSLCVLQCNSTPVTVYIAVHQYSYQSVSCNAALAYSCHCVCSIQQYSSHVYPAIQQYSCRGTFLLSIETIVLLWCAQQCNDQRNCINCNSIVLLLSCTLQCYNIDCNCLPCNVTISLTLWTLQCSSITATILVYLAVQQYSSHCIFPYSNATIVLLWCTLQFNNSPVVMFEYLT